MTQLANVDTVLAPFNGEEVALGDWRLRMTRRDGEFFVERRLSSAAKDQAPAVETGRVVMTTGSHHQQVYWIRRDGSNFLDPLPMVWLLDEASDARWVPRQACFLRSPDMPALSSPTWNTNCIWCHSVNGVPGVDLSAVSAVTRVAELGIACEACHGPGQAHIAAYKDVSGKRGKAGDDTAATAIVNPKRLPPDRSAQVCGQCHSFRDFSNSQFYEDWFLFGAPYRPGNDLHETYALASLGAPTDESKGNAEHIESNFWPDGMLRVGGREYNGLLESACYQRGGLTCITCHSMHDSDPNDMLGADMDTNEACYRCHSSYRQGLESHSHHLANSSGSLCYNCHMPHTSYSLLKGIRSHQISSPDIAATLDSGRPNACNLCHLDQTLAWSSEKLSEWYGQKPVQFDEDQRSISAAILWMLRGDAVQRALLAWSCGWPAARGASGEEWQPPFLARLLEDPYSAVRLIAGRSLKKLGYDLDFDYLAPAEALSTARREALKHWERRMAESKRGFPLRVLLNQERRLREEEVERLISTRDDRPLFIAE